MEKNKTQPNYIKEISSSTLEEVLGLKKGTITDAEKMAATLKVTFFPNKNDDTDKTIIEFSKRIELELKKLHVKVIPFEDALIYLPWKKVCKRFLRILTSNVFYILSRITGKEYSVPFLGFESLRMSLKRQRVAPGVNIISIGEQKGDSLPIDWLSSYKDSSVVSILPLPDEVERDSDFKTHFDVAMRLFSHHMSHIVIGVRDEFWLLYNFNASHPTFDIDEGLREPLLSTLIPKLAAPISPVQMKEFSIVKEPFNPDDDEHKPFVEDMVAGGKKLAETGLWPSGKRVDELPFRNMMHRWIGSIHLDSRSGMSYGFLARQLPLAATSDVISYEEAVRRFGKTKVTHEEDYVWHDKNLYIRLQLSDGLFFLRVPEVWVLTQRSGCDKTNMDPTKDLVKIGLKNGKMMLQVPRNLKITSDFRTSFDTQVILAHAVGNAIVAIISDHFFSDNHFAEQIKKQGAAIGHWHGYIDPEKLEKGWYVHGSMNPHVACSSPQSAIYALEGKINTFSEIVSRGDDPFLGDIHIEPHHGSNIIYPSLSKLATYLTTNVASLGNEYLDSW